MKKIRKFLAALTALLVILAGASGTAQALSVTWAFLFPVPLPLPVWNVEHPPSFVTIGFLFPIWLPLPFYRYGPRGPIEPRFEGDNGAADMVVLIDGKEIGKVSEIKGQPKLPDGAHVVEYRNNGRRVYLARFYVKNGQVYGGVSKDR